MTAPRALLALLVALATAWPVGARAAGVCPRCDGDLDGDDQVSVSEVIRAVNNVLNGCPHTAQYVANSVRLPFDHNESAFDLDGDGRLDNQFGNLVGVLASSGLDLQGKVDQALANGELIVLLDETSRDSSFSSDSSARASVYLGAPQVNPDFSGAGHFSIDMTAFPGMFSGPIVDSRFDSDSPAAASKPVQLLLALPFFGTIVRVPVTAAHLQYRQTGGALASGQLNAAIRTSDLQTTVLPAIAQALAARVAADPDSSTSHALLQLFDTGGAADGACGTTCRNPDASCATAGDSVIATCEVGTNALIANVLAGDLDLFNADGDYQPTPHGPDRDSYSIGIGLTAVGAVF